MVTKINNYIVVEDGKQNKSFQTQAEAKVYFKKRKSFNKGKLTLMALYKKSGDKWIGILQN